jgi:protein TonB
MDDGGAIMSHPSDIESSTHPDGLQKIRSWASRSPESIRPEFRARPGPIRLGRSFRLAASIWLALLFLVVLAGSRFLQDATPGTPKPAAASGPAPEPEQAAQVAQPSDDAPPPPAETVVADLPQARREPVQAVQASRPARSMAPEHPGKEAAAIPRKPIRQEPARAASRTEVSPAEFESEPAVVLAAPAAEYPDAARGTGTSAEVVVGFTIDETGAVRYAVIESTRIQGDAPKAPFEEAALAAARRARFTPAREHGVPTRSWSTLTFSFESGPSFAGI